MKCASSIAEENFVRKIAVHRLLFKHSFHVSTTLWMVSWLQLLRELDFTWGFTESQIRQFCLLTYLPSVKCAFYSKNCRQPHAAQALIPRIYNVVNGQLASFVAWVGFYMDVGVDLNAKKRQNVPKNSPNSWEWRGIDTFGTSATFSLTIMIFSAERAKRWCTHCPFNICNHFKFRHNFANCLHSWTIV